MIEKIIRWVLFCAGIITSIFAGYMFYIDNIAGGAAWLAVAVGCLSFSVRVTHSSDSSQEIQDSEENDQDLHDLAILISDIALMSLKNIGRTVPPGTKEIEGLEKKLNHFLDLMPVDKTEREEIDEEFDRLKNRTRRNESGKAFYKSGFRN